METPGLLDASVPIEVLPSFQRVNAALLDLLRTFTPDDWLRPTVHVDRSVKELATHLLQTTLMRVAAVRDGYRLPMPPITSTADLVGWIQQTNRHFMAGTKWLSPQMMIELLERYDGEMLARFAALDPDAAGLGVAWAGEAVSKHWFDVAREYTEKWHHQQQLRDATGRPALYEPALLAPVLETFARGLPFAYRDCRLPDGARVVVEVTGAVELAWTLRREDGAWSLWSARDERPLASISLPADVAWRVWTKGIGPEAARELMTVDGDDALALPLTRFVAIMA